MALERKLEEQAKQQHHMEKLEAQLKMLEKTLHAVALERKLEEQTKQQHKALEARIKEERMREELQAVKEKTRFLEFTAKILAQVKEHQEREQLGKIQHHMEKLEAQLKKLEKTLHAMANGKRNSEAILFEASEQEDIPEKRALIIVNLPENAKLFLNNQLRKGTSKQRFILTPQLEDGEHTFTLRVEWERNGRVRSQTRNVTLRRGMHVRVSFEP